uniref:Uncharacterized protein n=1 Tax=Parascaris univalens TaxID=6257 RepID=A0A915B255_PARUN
MMYSITDVPTSAPTVPCFTIATKSTFTPLVTFLMAVTSARCRCVLMWKRLANPVTSMAISLIARSAFTVETTIGVSTNGVLTTCVITALAFI